MRVASVSDIGKLVAAGRRGLGLTQVQLARAVGASQHWISRVEAGKPTAQIGKILGVLAHLGVRLQVAEAPWLTASGKSAKSVPGSSLESIIAAHSGKGARHKKARP